MSAPATFATTIPLSKAEDVEVVILRLPSGELVARTARELELVRPATPSNAPTTRRP